MGFINAQVYDGYTLFTPMSAFDDSATTYLMNNDYESLNTWTHDQGPASMPYLLRDGSIIYPYRVPFPAMSSGGSFLFFNLLRESSFCFLIANNDLLARIISPRAPCLIIRIFFG